MTASVRGFSDCAIAAAKQINKIHVSFILAPLPPDRIGESSVAGHVPHGQTAPLPIQAIGLPLKHGISERARRLERNNLPESLRAIAPDDLGELERKSPLNVCLHVDPVLRS